MKGIVLVGATGSIGRSSLDVVRALRKIGCEAPIGVEVFSDELAGLEPEELGRRCGDSTRAVLAAAGA